MEANYIFESEVSIVNTIPYSTETETYDIVSNSLIDNINNEIQKSLEGLDGKGLAKCPPNELDKDLLLSTIPKVELIKNIPYCRCSVVAKRELSGEEIDIVKKDLLAEYSDGWGLGFEQLVIDTVYMTYEEDEEEDGEYITNEYEFMSEIYVRFWEGQTDKDFNVYKEDKEGKLEIIENNLNLPSKVRVKLVGENGNIFNLVAIASRELAKYGYKDEARKLKEEILSCKSYDESLRLIMDYVDVY